MRKLLAIFLSVLLLAVCVPLGALPAISVAAETTSGTTGDCIWTLDGTHLTISGNGAMDWYGSYTAPWGKDITSVTIEDGVTTIGECAFYDCDFLTSVTIPTSVTTIEYMAFAYCDSLIDVYYAGTWDQMLQISIKENNDGVTDAFWHCTDREPIRRGTTGDCTWAMDKSGHLTISGNGAMGDYAEGHGNGASIDPPPWSWWDITSVTIEDGVTSIGSGAFYYCTALTSVTIPDSVTSIEFDAFCYCSSLPSITIPDSVTSIGSSAFFYCTALTSITIPDSVTSIGIGAFYGCKTLTDLTIPDSVTSIGSSAFSGCDSLTDVYYGGTWEQMTQITIDGGNDTLGGAIWHCTDKDLPGRWGTTGDCFWAVDKDGHLIIFGNGAMGNYYYLYTSTPWGRDITSVTIEDGVTAIGNSAFYSCNSLTSVTIPDSVTTIEDYAFFGCMALTSVTIPANVTAIGEDAFLACESLNEVHITDIAAWCGINFGGSDSSSNPLSSAENLYLNGELVTDLVIPDSVTTIGDYAFWYCTSLTSITIPDSVTTIGEEAFRNCRSLTSVTIGNSVTTIGESAFAYCTSLTEVTIPDSVTSIGRSAFSNCKSLTDVYYGGSEADKANITIGSYNNLLLNATWHYNDAPICTHVYDDDNDADCNACGALRWVVCPDTDVTIRNEDGTTLPAGTTVTVDEVAIDEIDVKLDEKAALEVYDISMLLNGQEIQPDGMVAVTLPAPADIDRYTDLQVVYIDDEVNVTPCETVVNEDGTITFYTDHFSYYAIIGTPISTPGDANGDGVVNNRDMALLQQYINKWDVTLDVDAMDVNDDGAVNNRDLALLQQYINKWDVELK